MKQFKEYIEGKRVLDIGCVGQVGSSEFSKFRQIDELKPLYHVGVDIQGDKLEAARKELGRDMYSLFYWDVTKHMPMNFAGLQKRESKIFPRADYPLYAQFDTIFMLEVIEHIDDCGSALENMYDLLNKNGHIIVSTPNPLFYKWHQQYIEKGKLNINPDHVHWFCPQTLEALFNRHRFRLVKYLHSNGVLGVFTR